MISNLVDFRYWWLAHPECKTYGEAVQKWKEEIKK